MGQSLIYMLVDIVKIMLVAYTWTRFEPVQEIIDKIPNKKNILYRLFSCSKCVALWFGIFFTFNIWVAMIASAMMFLYEKEFSSWEKRIRL